VEIIKKTKIMKFNLKEKIKTPRFLGAVLLITSVVFGILFRIFGAHWMYIAAFVPWGLIIPFALVGLVFAFIINPIKRAKEKREEKKKKEEENK